MSITRTIMIFFVVLMLLMFANLVLLDIKIFSELKGVATGGAVPTQIVTKTPAELEPTSIPTLSESTPTPTAKTRVNPDYIGVKEAYIPFGSGSTKSTEWVEIPGLEAVIDTANYPTPKIVMFEASLRIPTANGKVYAKLYNVTDKHDAWFSEVSAEGSTSYRAESGNVVLASGRKVYRVMMKSTLGFEAFIDNSRLKILWE